MNNFVYNYDIIFPLNNFRFENLAEPLVQSSVDIYMRIQKELLPTPLRSHYTFNLRDLSKVFQVII